MTDQILNTNRRTLGDDPQYFGVYFNMARHNIFQILNAVVNKFRYLSFRELKDDEDISFKITDVPDDSHIIYIFHHKHPMHRDHAEQVYHYLARYMPCITIFGRLQENSSEFYIDFDNLYSFLNEAFDQINRFRNTFSHYAAVDTDRNVINRIYTVSPLLEEYLQELFKEAPFLTHKRFKSTHADIEDTFNENDFEHLHLYKIFEASAFNSRGIFFFASLFLEQKYAYHFLKKFNGFKNETISPFKATLRVFTAYTIRLPYDKLLSNNPKQSLLLDMLNELSKIPRQLYQVVSEKDQTPFNSIDDNSLTRILDNTHENSYNDINHLLHKIAPLRRSENRFAYFALRYLEEENILKEFSFQITVGKVEYIPYHKHILGEDRPRRIQFIVKAFGKLKDFQDEDQVMGKICSQIGSTDRDRLYFVQFNPHYNLEDSRLIFQDTTDNISHTLIQKRATERFYAEQPVPTGFISQHDLPKIMMAVLLGERDPWHRIKGIISSQLFVLNKFSTDVIRDIRTELKEQLVPKGFTARLDALKLVNGKIPLLEHKKRKEYRDYINIRRDVLKESSFFQDAKNNKVAVSKLPKKLFHQLIDIQPVSSRKKIQNFLKQELKTVGLRLRQMEIGELPKVGEIATYLARDIISMLISVEVKQRLTSIYYKDIQHAIAYFPLEKGRLADLISALGLFSNDTGHPFLKRTLIAQSASVIEFYENYLLQKERYLNYTFVKSIGKGRERKIFYQLPDNSPIPYVYKHKLAKDDSNFDQWLSNKKKMPVYIPQAIFDPLVNELLRKHIGEEVGSDEKFTGLLNRYFAEDIQPFYRLQRIYKNQKTKKEEIVDIAKMKHRDIKIRYGTYAQENERQIRYMQTQDRVIKLMCDNILKGNNEIQMDQSLRLRNFYPDSPVHPLDMPVSLMQSMGDYQIIAVDNEEKKVYQKSLLDSPTWIGYTWTVKESGVFRKILYDKRINHLLGYFLGQRVHIDLITYELAEYDRIREKIFDLLFRLEEKIFTDFKEEVIDSKLKSRQKSEKYNFDEIQFSIYEQLLRDKYGINGVDYITTARNKFAHSQYIPFKDSNIDQITIAEQQEFVNNWFRKDWIRTNYTSIAQRLYNQVEVLISAII